jgi:hypothetical protein
MLNEYFGGVRIQDFNFDMVKDYILKMKTAKSPKTGRSVADDTIINYLDFLKAALNLYYDNNDIPIPANVRKFFRYKKHLTGKYKLKKRAREDTFTKDKLELILQWLENEETKLILETMINVPSRIGEYVKSANTMKKSQFEYPYLTLIPDKDGETRTVELPKEFADRYQKMIDKSETDYIFNVSYRAVYGQFERVCKTLKIKNVIHQLRIRAATEAFSKRFDVKEVQGLGGWKTESMPLKYYKLNKDRLKKQSKRLFN